MTVNPIYRVLIWLLLLLGLASSVAAGYWMKLDIDRHEYQQFSYYCEEIKLKIQARLRAAEQILLSGAATFDASDEVIRQEWQAYAQRLRIHEHFQGVQGLGFALWIPSSQLPAHKARIRAEGFPDYTIHPEGEREFYSSIIYLEPFTERNLRAFGYDMYSEPVRRVAMMRARDENIVALSGRVTLVQETDKDVQLGTLMYAPVYRKNQPLDTVEQRRAALYGWVYSPFRMNDLLNNILSSTQNIQANQVHLRVYDGNMIAAEHLLYDSQPNYKEPNIVKRVFAVEITSDFNGTTWTLRFEQIADINQLNYIRAWVTLGVGVLISILLFLLARSYLTMRIRAVNIAAHLTKQLQESESRFRVLADSAPVLIWIAGLDKLCFHFNKVWLDFTGRTLEQEQGNGWVEGVHPDDRQQCLDIYINSFDAQLPFKMEYRLRRYDGEYRWLLDNGVPRFSADGTFLGYIGSCIDITDRKQTEQLLQRESEKNLALLRNASDGIHILNSDGTIFEVSDSFCSMLGYQHNEMIGMHVTQWDSHFTAEECKAVIAAQLAKPTHSLFETQHRCKDGTIIDVEVSSFPMELEGKPVLFNSSRNITERKRIEKILYENQVLLQTAQRAARLGHYVMDLRNRDAITWTNDTLFDEIFGIDKSFNRDLTNLAHIIHSEDLPRVEQHFTTHQNKHSAKNSIDSIEYRIIRPDNGEQRWIEKYGYTFYDDQNNPIQQVGMVQDITERKQLEEQLRNNSLYTRNLIEVSLDPLVTISVNGKITDVNRATEKVTGFTREQLINSNFADYFTDPDKANAGYLEAFSNGYVTDYSLAIKHRDGHLTDVIYNAVVYKNESGDIMGVFAAARDITELKRTEQELIKEQQQLQSIITGTNAGTWEWNIQTGKLVLNERWANIIGYELTELQPISIQTWLELCHPDDLKRSSELLEQHFAGKLDYYDCECRVKHKQGHWVWVMDRGRVVAYSEDGKPLLMAGTHIDISAFKQTEEKLRIAATIFESQEGMLITDANEVIINVNQAFTKITGYNASEVIGQTPRIFQSDRHEPAFYKQMWHSIQTKGAWQGEIWNRRKNGDIYPEQLTITAVKNDDDIITHYVATLNDITERKSTEEYINRLAFYDALTQLPNRRLLQERLKHSIDLYHRTGHQTAVFMMDLDKFKAVNDTLGHAAGDELLQQVAKRVKGRLREVDMVARLGGDEFVILIDNVTRQENLAYIADSIIHTLSQSFTIQEHEVYIGASIGIAIHPQHGDSVDALIDHADTALYHAKGQGRGRCVYFSDALTQKIRDRVVLEARLRSAIEQQQLSINFQPQICITTGHIVGAEILVRWYDLFEGCLMPNEFISFAEETGLIIPIGEWVLKETCKFGKQWLDKGLPPIVLAVNISPYQFHRGDMVALVTKTLEDTNFPAHYLGLEITETGLMNNQEQALPILNSLYEQGVQLIIDNFGSGYSSLSHLKHFPVHTLKIDKTFIKDIPFSKDDCAIASSIIAMAHHLGFKVLAEGVETGEQLAFLRQQGCDSYQGYWHTEPLPADLFTILLKSKPERS
jgi:diguanylate cyclase (GGDEF)-like protein/PAS domain S-box-containing protein